VNQILAQGNRQVWVRASDGTVAGVCKGLARLLGIEAWIVRLLWLLVVLAFGTGILFYLLAVICLPREDRVVDSEQRKIMGVCLRISRTTNVEVGLVRLIALSSLLLSAGMTLVVYFVLYFVLPSDAELSNTIDVRSRSSATVG